MKNLKSILEYKLSKNVILSGYKKDAESYIHNSNRFCFDIKI